ncbi:MAG: hypothetical protein Fur0042_19320 [Cyanophyceae cyanobacterium]
MAEGANPADHFLDRLNRYTPHDGPPLGTPEAPSDPIQGPLPTLPASGHAKLKRGTFQVRESVLEELDRYHLELQLALGKANAPYKEVMVEAALVLFLESVRAEPGPWLDLLQEWQRRRKQGH